MDLLVLVGCVLLLIGTAAIWGWRFLVLLFLAGNLHGSFLRVPALISADPRCVADGQRDPSRNQCLEEQTVRGFADPLKELSDGGESRVLTHDPALPFVGSSADLLAPANAVRYVGLFTPKLTHSWNLRRQLDSFGNLQVSVRYWAKP